MRVMWFQALVVSAKSGGRAKARVSARVVRVVYFNRFASGEIWLLLMYAKSVRDNIPADILRALKQEIENAND